MKKKFLHDLVIYNEACGLERKPKSAEAKTRGSDQAIRVFYGQLDITATSNRIAKFKLTLIIEPSNFTNIRSMP